MIQLVFATKFYTPGTVTTLGVWEYVLCTPPPTNQSVLSVFCNLFLSLSFFIIKYIKIINLEPDLTRPSKIDMNHFSINLFSIYIQRLYNVFLSVKWFKYENITHSYTGFLTVFYENC